MIDVEKPFAAPPLGPQTSLTLAQAARNFFGKSSPRIILLAVLVPLVLRVMVGAFELRELAIVPVVVIVWAFQEWFAHKHLLHIKPVKLFGREFDLYFAREHRRHHRTPWSFDGALLPLRVLLAAIPVNAALWLLLSPTLGFALTGIATYSAASLVYEWTHSLTHTPYPPRGALYRRICKAHRLHHFKNEGYWYGFTLPWVDDLFHTAPDPSTVPLSPTCRTLGVEAESSRAFVL